MMQINYMKSAIASVGTLVVGLLVGYLIFPAILRALLKSQLNLKPGTDIREMFGEIPFPLDFKIYLFNVTNPEGIMNGEKPHVQEVGPYFFEEWKVKYDQVDDPVEDTLAFTLKNTFNFRVDKSNGLTGDEEITMFNPLMMLSLIMVKRDREPLLPLVSKAINIIFHHPENAFAKVRVMDLLFDGILVDCSSHEYAAKAICSAWTSEGQNVKKLNNTHVVFSFFGGKNGTDGGRFVVYRGVKNIRDLGRVMKFNDEPIQDVWDGDTCNEIIGTDSTIFAPFTKKGESIWAFTPDICRSMATHYVGPSSYAGMPTSAYSLDMGDIKNTEALHCFCRNPPDDCPVKGTMDLTQCVGAPLVASKPHFLDGHSSLTENVHGLSPNRKQHDVFMHFEIISGTPLSGAKRLQFNIDLEPIENLNITKDLPRAVIPMFWVEEGVTLNKTYTNMLKYQLFLALKFNEAIKWITISIGIIGMLGSGFMFYKKQNVKQTVTPVAINAPAAGKVVLNDGMNELNCINKPVTISTISNAAKDIK